MRDSQSFLFPSSKKGRLARDKAGPVRSIPVAVPVKRPVLPANRIDPQVILDYYRGVEGVKRPKRELALDPAQFTLSNTPQGLGDCVILSPLPGIAREHGIEASIFSTSTFFRPLTGFIPGFKDNTRPFWVVAAELNMKYDLGNGHFIQRLIRAFGLPPMDVPKGALSVPGAMVVPGRVVMHFEAGGHANWQKVAIHPRARQLYPENRQILEHFISRHHEMEFVELGYNPTGIEGAREFGRRSLEDTIEFMATASHFIGIISGPMHVATALGLKVITVINFPDAEKIYLPTLKNIDQVESEWHYPTAVHLHQDGEGPLVSRYSLDNLERALNGEIYPFWSTDYCHLIHEKL